jgi:hypothetical protein
MKRRESRGRSAAPTAPLESEAAQPRPRRLALALGSAALAVSLAVFIVLAAGGSNRPSRAYGAELVRFAESTPLLLLEAPGWRVQNVSETGSGVYMPRSSRGPLPERLPPRLLAERPLPFSLRVGGMGQLLFVSLSHTPRGANYAPDLRGYGEPASVGFEGGATKALTAP